MITDAQTLGLDWSQYPDPDRKYLDTACKSEYVAQVDQRG